MAHVRNTLATKQPLQDITDRYLLHPSPNVDLPTPISRPKSTRPMLPSSLPPSSPPSASSGLLTDHHLQPMLSPGPEHLGLEIDEPGHVKTAGGLDTYSRADSDPFGFFALEDKLRILRSHQQIKPARPPQIQTVYKDLTTPPTPSKRRNKRKAVRSPIPSSKDGFEPDSMPSTPLKPISRKGKEKVVLQDKPTPEAESDGDSLQTLTSSLKSNSRRRRNVKDLLKESGNSSERYSLRRTDAAANSGKDVSSRRVARCASMAEVVVKATRVKPRVKRTAKPTSNANMDIRKWEQERQARLDYFKKLDGYQLEKENVYVV